jgi:hypothetical protein
VAAVPASVVVIEGAVTWQPPGPTAAAGVQSVGGEWGGEWGGGTRKEGSGRWELTCDAATVGHGPTVAVTRSGRRWRGGGGRASTWAVLPSPTTLTSRSRATREKKIAKSTRPLLVLYDSIVVN